MGVGAAVADASVVGFVIFTFLAPIGLLIDEEGAGFEDRGFVCFAPAGDEGHDRRRVVVGGEAFAVDAAVVLLLGQQPVETFRGVGGFLCLGIEIGIANSSGEGEGGDRGDGGVAPVSIGVLL